MTGTCTSITDDRRYVASLSDLDHGERPKQRRWLPSWLKFELQNRNWIKIWHLCICVERIFV